MTSPPRRKEDWIGDHMMSRYQDQGGDPHGGYRHPLRVPDRYIARGRDAMNRDSGRDRDLGRHHREPTEPYRRSRGARGYEEPPAPYLNHPPMATAYFNERIRPPGLISKYPNYEPFHPPPAANFQYPEYMKPPAKDIKERKPRRHSSRSRSRSYSRSRSRSRSRERDRHDSYQNCDSSSSRNYSPTRHRHRSRSDRRSRSGSRSNLHSRSRSRSQSKSNSRSRSRSGSRSELKSGSGGDEVKRTLKYWEQGENGDDEDSEVDLEVDLHPLDYHVHSRKRLLMEAVRSLKGKRLKAMIPPLIKNMSIERLQSECLKILEGEDSEIILNILEGKMTAPFDNSSSVKQAVKDEATSNEVEKKIKTKKVGVQNPKMKKIKKSEETDKIKRKKKKIKVETEVEDLKSKKKKKSKSKKEKKKGKKTQETSSTGSSLPNNRSLMELLELEYRAKAIKALLRAQGVTGLDIDVAVGNDVTKVEPLKICMPPTSLPTTTMKLDCLPASPPTTELDDRLSTAPPTTELNCLQTSPSPPTAELNFFQNSPKASELDGLQNSPSPTKLDCIPSSPKTSELDFDPNSPKTSELDFEPNSPKPSELDFEPNSPKTSELDCLQNSPQTPKSDYLLTSQTPESDCFPNSPPTIELDNLPTSPRTIELDNLPTSRMLQGCSTQDDVSNASNNSNSKFSNISDEDNLSTAIDTRNVSDKEEISGGDEVTRQDESCTVVQEKEEEKKEEDQDEEPQPITWYERWFQSKSMQKMVKTNSIQTKLKKKLKKPKNETKSEPPPPDLSKDAGEPIIGSIEEYEKLFGKKKCLPENEDKKEVEKPNPENPERDDEEDGALWVDIFGDDV